MENRSKQDSIWPQCQLVKQYEIDGNRNVKEKTLKMSQLRFSIRTIEVDWLKYGSMIMNTHSQNLFYLEKRPGVMMKSRKVVLFRMYRILVQLILSLKNQLVISHSQKHEISLDHMPSDMINKIGRKLQDRYIVPINFLEALRNTRSNKPQSSLMSCKFKIQLVLMMNQTFCHLQRQQWYVNWHK